jgi:hypothetical protein
MKESLVAFMVDVRNSYKVLVGKLEGKRSLDGGGELVWLRIRTSGGLL